MEAISTVAIEVEDLDDVRRCSRPPRGRRAARPGGAAGEAAASPTSGACGTRPRVERVRRPGATRVCPGCRDCDASLGGDGTPGVAAFVAEELGAAMGISTQSAMALMADALDLRHRFPQLWAKVEAGEVAPWKTRRVAADTRSLPFEAARWIDEELAGRVDGFGLPTIERLVALAAARFAPEEQAEKEQRRRVRSPRDAEPPAARASSPAPPGSRPPATPKDLTAFYQLVCDIAKQLGRLGDTDDYETRKAKALGIIAGRQGALDLTGEAAGRPAGHPAAGATNLYVHVSLADLATHLGGDPTVGEVEKLGPATLDLIRTWLQDSKARIQPVLDLNRTDAVDQHDPPPWMREQVILRDRHCVFPWCGRDARADRPRPHRALRPDGRRRTTRPDAPQQPRPVVSTTSPRQDLHRLDTTNAPATAPTTGPAPTATPGPSDPTAPAVRPRPHPPRGPSRGVHPRHLTGCAVDPLHPLRPDLPHRPCFPRPTGETTVTPATRPRAGAATRTPRWTSRP